MVSGFIGGWMIIRFERAPGQVRDTAHNATSTLTVPPSIVLPDQNNDSAVSNAEETAADESAESDVRQSGARIPDAKKGTINRESSAQLERHRANYRTERGRQQSLNEVQKPEPQTEGTRPRRVNSKPDDIFRIADIFEGSRRP